MVAAQVTPERAYRAIGLRMHSKVQAVLEAKHARAKEDIDIEELQDKITIRTPAASIAGAPSWTLTLNCQTVRILTSSSTMRYKS